MKLKAIEASIAAVGLAMGISSAASAAIIPPTLVTGTSFIDLLTTIDVVSTSDITGDIFTSSGVVYIGPIPVSLDTALAGVQLGGYTLTDFDSVAPGFQFSLTGVAPGSYSLYVAGFTASGYGLVAGDYTLTPSIPEPESAALLLAGVGLVGLLIARRRSSRD